VAVIASAGHFKPVTASTTTALLTVLDYINQDGDSAFYSNG